MPKEKIVCRGKCSTCNSLNFVASSQRFCYEARFGLPRNTGQMRYTAGGRTHIVATGIIDDTRKREDFGGTSPKGMKGGIEENFRKIEYKREVNRFDYVYILQEACKKLHYNAARLMAAMLKIKKEVVKNGEVDAGVDEGLGENGKRVGGDNPS